VARFSDLISPAELAGLLGDPALRIIDCRASLQDPHAGEEAYSKAHLPRAGFADLNHDLSGPVVPGKTGRHPLPELEGFVEKLCTWGVGAGNQVVVYDDSAGAFAARLWWLLRWLGHEAVALLDGGFSAWVVDGGPITDQLVLPERAHFTPRLRPELLVSVAELTAPRSIARRLFDARAPERFRGEVEPIDPVAGHIPGATNLPFSDNLSASRFLAPAVLRQRLALALDGTPSEDAIVYCGSGVTACHDVLAFARAGLPLPRLYAGSWSEWITDPARPTERHGDR
jgi:thiosulfate/3-mercaptopyruvate sulfurtransferase